jgi:cellulose synthase/poly-beta-1,6-N-acetylglucosamine synthase-like glycosyltransferase
VTGTELAWGVVFFVSLLFNFRAAFKLLIDWKGMVTTCRFVEEAYARVPSLPDEAQFAREPRAPVFLCLVPAYQEPDVGGTIRALLAQSYPHDRMHIAVITKEEEERAPHPLMRISTGELVRRLRTELPPYQQKVLSPLMMPGPGRKAEQLNWALRPEHLAAMLGEDYRPEDVIVGVSDADSIPDRHTLRWIAAEELAGRRAAAYQGVTLSFANFDRLDVRGRVCAIQQSSIFIRVSIARLINEARRIRLFERLARRTPRLGRALRPAFDFCLRRSQICLGHNSFTRLDVLQQIGGFPTGGATEDSTLGYALGASGILIRPLPMLELTDLPETSEKVIRQNARWYKGVLDDIEFLWRTWQARRSAYNLAQLGRHVGNKVIEWPVAAGIYPVVGFFGWHLAYVYWDRPVLFTLSLAFPSVALGLTIWVGGIVTQELLESLVPYLPRRVDLRRTTLKAKFFGIFRCQTYWLLATRGAWRVLLALAREGKFEPRKTDRITR